MGALGLVASESASFCKSPLSLQERRAALAAESAGPAACTAWEAMKWSRVGTGAAPGVRGLNPTGKVLKPAEAGRFGTQRPSSLFSPLHVLTFP